MAKAGRPKKDSIDLPAWFDIDKYKPARNLDALAWHDQLTFRRQMLSGIDACIQAGDFEYQELNGAWQMLHADPIITEERVNESHVRVVMEQTCDDSPELGHSCFKSGYIEVDPIIGRTVRPMNGSAVTALGLGHRLDIAPTEYDMEMGVMGSLTLNQDGSLDFKDVPLTWRGRPILAIDPALNDDIIMREVRQFLGEIRKTSKAPRLAFTKNSDFSKWYRYDLVIFSSQDYILQAGF